MSILFRVNLFIGVMGANSLLFDHAISRSADALEQKREQQVSTPNVLFVIPGFGGDERRLNITIENMEHLTGGALNGHFHCIVYLWQDADFDSSLIEPCRVDREHLSDAKFQGQVAKLQEQIASYKRSELADDAEAMGAHLWTFFMKSVTREQIQSHTHVAVLLDDVNITGVDVPDMLSTMDIHDLSVAAPSTDGSVHKIVNPYFNHEGCNGTQQAQEITFIEVQFTIFRPADYECWQSIIDIELNPVGWAMDRFFQSACNPRMGIFDKYQAHHHIEYQAHHHVGHSYDTTGVAAQLRAYKSMMEKKGYNITYGERGRCLGKESAEDPPLSS